MSLLDRLRPRWHHSDPDVRVEAVRQLAREEQELLGAVARHDEDTRVRRSAIKKLDSAEILLKVARADAEQALRELAAERAESILTGTATSDRPLAECEAALGQLSRMATVHAMVVVARTATHARIRTTALAALTDQKTLGEVARAAQDVDIRRGAVARITDFSVLRTVAIGEGPVDIASAALEKIDDPEILHAITENRSALKAVRHGAQARLDGLISNDHPIRVKQRQEQQQSLCAAAETAAHMTNVAKAAEHMGELQHEWEKLAAHTAPADELARRFAQATTIVLEEVARQDRERAAQDRLEADLEESLLARRALCERIEAVDGEHAQREVNDARATWDRLASVSVDQDRPLAQRFLQACERGESRYQRWQRRDAFRQQLEALVVEAEALASAGPAPEATGHWAALEGRWRTLDASSDPHNQDPAEPALRQRLEQAGERLLAQLTEATAELEQRKAENLARLTALCTHLDEMSVTDAFDVRPAHRALEASEAAVRDIGPLPSSEKRGWWRARLTEARQKLQRRFDEQRNTEEWRRWANAAVQENLIQQTEALRESTDLPDVARHLRRIQEEWKQASTAPPDQAQALWARYHKIRDVLHQRCDAFFKDNLRKKEALCVQVEALADSTDWKETAEAIRRLQTEWKGIGPVLQRKSQSVWQRFRAPCDKFFERRNEHFSRLKSEWDENAKKKAALCERVEALADSAEWETVTDEIKRLQAEWKQIGPAARKQSDALWGRFRTACDRFFDRRNRRDEIELEQQMTGATEACNALDALVEALQGEEAPALDAIGETIRRSWDEWKQLPAASSDTVRALRNRFRQAWEQIGTARPESLAGTPLDPDSHRKRREKLCIRMEELLASCSPQAEASVQDLAARLKQAMAANTIGGSAGPRQMSRRAAAEEADRLHTSWDRLGPIIGAEARALCDRFDRAHGGVTKHIGSRRDPGPESRATPRGAPRRESSRR
jgi:hypothetical protein